MSSDQARLRSGMWYGIAAYGAWGLVPLYFNSVNCPAHEIVAHRVLWSFVVLALIITLFRRWPEVGAIFKSKSTLLMLFASGYLVAGNWYVYVYSATSGQITQASLGYFILPLVNAFLGVTIFRERIRLLQVIALAFAASGVLYMALSLGKFPWIGITLAISFAFYGVLRKIVPADGVLGLFVETVLLAPTAITLLIVWELSEGLHFAHFGLKTDLLIACSGIVTTFPLICFAQAIRRIPLVTLGFMQYISPTLQLCVAIYVYGEAFTSQHQVSFGLIWVGLLIFGWDGIRTSRTKNQSATPVSLEEPILMEVEMKKATA